VFLIFVRQKPAIWDFNTVLGSCEWRHTGGVTASFIFRSVLGRFELTLRRGRFTAGTHCTLGRVSPQN